MKVTIAFGSIGIVVPCSDEQMTIGELTKRAVVRYRKAVAKPSEYPVVIHSLRSTVSGGILDPDDQIMDVIDNNEQICAIFSEGDSCHRDKSIIIPNPTVHGSSAGNSGSMSSPGSNVEAPSPDAADEVAAMGSYRPNDAFARFDHRGSSDRSTGGSGQFRARGGYNPHQSSVSSGYHSSSGRLKRPGDKQDSVPDPSGQPTVIPSEPVFPLISGEPTANPSQAWPVGFYKPKPQSTHAENMVEVKSLDWNAASNKLSVRRGSEPSLNQDSTNSSSRVKENFGMDRLDPLSTETPMATPIHSYKTEIRRGNTNLLSGDPPASLSSSVFVNPSPTNLDSPAVLRKMTKVPGQIVGTVAAVTQPTALYTNNAMSVSFVEPLLSNREYSESTDFDDGKDDFLSYDRRYDRKWGTQPDLHDGVGDSPLGSPGSEAAGRLYEKNSQSLQRSAGRFARSAARQSVYTDQWLDAADKAGERYWEKQTNKSPAPSDNSSSSDGGSHAKRRESVTDAINIVETSFITLKCDLTRPMGVSLKPYYSESGHFSGLLVSAIDPFGRVARDGRVAVDDRITEVNGTSLGTLSFASAQILFNEVTAKGAASLQLVRVKARSILASPPLNRSATPSASGGPFPSSNENSRVIKMDTMSSSKSLTLSPKSVEFNYEAKLHSANKAATLPGTPSRSVSGPVGGSIANSSATSATGSTPGLTQTTLQKANTRKMGKKIEIKLLKGNDGLGFSVTTRDISAGGPQPKYIKTILPKGAAIVDGRLKAGDRLLEINGEDITPKSQKDVVSILRSILPNSTVELVVSRQESRSPILPRQMPPEEKSSPVDCSQQPPVQIPKQLHCFEISLNSSGSAGLGLSVKGRSSDKHHLDLGIFIKAILTGGAAHKDGRLRMNDQLVSIHGRQLLGHSNESAMAIIRTAMQELPVNANHIQVSVLRALDPEDLRVLRSPGGDEGAPGGSVFYPSAGAGAGGGSLIYKTAEMWLTADGLQSTAPPTLHNATFNLDDDWNVGGRGRGESPSAGSGGGRSTPGEGSSRTLPKMYGGASSSSAVLHHSESHRNISKTDTGFPSKTSPHHYTVPGYGEYAVVVKGERPMVIDDNGGENYVTVVGNSGMVDNGSMISRLMAGGIGGGGGGYISGRKSVGWDSSNSPTIMDQRSSQDEGSVTETSSVLGMDADPFNRDAPMRKSMSEKRTAFGKVDPTNTLTYQRIKHARQASAPHLHSSDSRDATASGSKKSTGDFNRTKNSLLDAGPMCRRSLSVESIPVSVMEPGKSTLPGNTPLIHEIALPPSQNGKQVSSSGRSAPAHHRVPKGLPRNYDIVGEHLYPMSDPEKSVEASREWENGVFIGREVGVDAEEDSFLLSRLRTQSINEQRRGSRDSATTSGKDTGGENSGFSRRQASLRERKRDREKRSSSGNYLKNWLRGLTKSQERTLKEAGAKENDQEQRAREHARRSAENEKERLSKDTPTVVRWDGYRFSSTAPFAHLVSGTLPPDYQFSHHPQPQYHPHPNHRLISSSTMLNVHPPYIPSRPSSQRHPIPPSHRQHLTPDFSSLPGAPMMLSRSRTTINPGMPTSVAMVAGNANLADGALTCTSKRPCGRQHDFSQSTAVARQTVPSHPLSSLGNSDNSQTTKRQPPVIPPHRPPRRGTTATRTTSTSSSQDVRDRTAPSRPDRRTGAEIPPSDLNIQHYQSKEHLLAETAPFNTTETPANHPTYSALAQDDLVALVRHQQTGVSKLKATKAQQYAPQSYPIRSTPRNDRSTSQANRNTSDSAANTAVVEQKESSAGNGPQPTNFINPLHQMTDARTFATQQFQRQLLQQKSKGGNPPTPPSFFPHQQTGTQTVVASLSSHPPSRPAIEPDSPERPTCRPASMQHKNRDGFPNSESNPLPVTATSSTSTAGAFYDRFLRPKTGRKSAAGAVRAHEKRRPASDFYGYGDNENSYAGDATKMGVKATVNMLNSGVPVANEGALAGVKQRPYVPSPLAGRHPAPYLASLAASSSVRYDSMDVPRSSAGNASSATVKDVKAIGNPTNLISSSLDSTHYSGRSEFPKIPAPDYDNDDRKIASTSSQPTPSFYGRLEEGDTVLWTQSASIGDPRSFSPGLRNIKERRSLPKNTYNYVVRM